MNFFESTQVLHNIDLSDSQKQVLAKAVQAGAIESPKVVQLDNEKLITARDLLDELGIIEYSHVNNTIKISDDHVDILRQSNVIDDTDQLTQDAQDLINGQVQEHIKFSAFCLL